MDCGWKNDTTKNRFGNIDAIDRLDYIALRMRICKLVFFMVMYRFLGLQGFALKHSTFRFTMCTILIAIHLKPNEVMYKKPNVHVVFVCCWRRARKPNSSAHTFHKRRSCNEEEIFQNYTFKLRTPFSLSHFDTAQTTYRLSVIKLTTACTVGGPGCNS